MSRAPSWPSEVTTPRTTLRTVTTRDVDLVHGWHTDPRLATDAPGAVAPARDWTARLVQRWVDDLAAGLPGYWIVHDRDGGEPVGIAGVRGVATDAWNLYYRLAPEVHGIGLGREVAAAAVASAVEFAPQRPVVALVKEHNAASLATALRAGLERTGSVKRLADDGPDTPPSSVLRAPEVVAASQVDAATREQLLDLWTAVNDAGGAVGFLPGAPRRDVAAVLDEHEAAMASGSHQLVLLRSPETDHADRHADRHADGHAAERSRIVAAGWWRRSDSPLLAHYVTALRVMTAPDRRGHNLGTLLMAAMHRVARETGAEHAGLDYRDGTGLGAFYARQGYREVGRWPDGVRLAPGEYRDSVLMARPLT